MSTSTAYAVGCDKQNRRSSTSSACSRCNLAGPWRGLSSDRKNGVVTKQRGKRTTARQFPLADVGVACNANWKECARAEQRIGHRCRAFPVDRCHFRAAHAHVLR
ncbi:hypothetical protein ABW21_db0203080 [Orbilia brochopaga]|nr:hypothetical protein ABW21_db0203080 [Drechslerella brochopaga]